MGVPTLTLLGYTSISTAESATGWSTYDTLDPDIVKEGNNSITGTFRSDATSGYFDNGSAPITAVGKTFRKWINTTNVAYMDTEVNGGYELLIYDGLTTEHKTMFSSDDYYGGWFNVVFDMNSFTTVTLANVQRWGLRIQHTASAKNVDNVWTDAYKYLDGYSMTGGTSGDPITLLDIEVADRGTTTLYGYGITTEFGGIYYCTGKIQFGTGVTTMYFEMDGDILVFEDKPIASGLYSLAGIGTGSTITIQNNSTIISSGTTDSTRFLFDWSDTDLLSLTCTDSLIARASTIKFKSGQTVTGNTFNDCGQITHGGANMNDCTVKNYEGTADTSALIYDINADPNGKIDDVSFIKGIASTHAIEFDATNTPTTITLTGIDFSGYNASNGNTDSTLYFPSTTKSYIVNLSGCTGNISYKVGLGGSVTLVSNPVTLTINVKDISTGDTLADARVLAWVSDNASGYPYLDSVTITGSGTTATVTHASHGMATSDDVIIRGANEDYYNGAYSITVSTGDTYTYTANETLVVSPATGTITSTFAFINEVTNSLGVVDDSRSLSASQPITGWIRKSSSSPYFKSQSITGTVDSSSGLTITAQLVRDE